MEIIDVKEQNKKEKDTFDIAFVGAMAIHKGSRILQELIRKCNDSKIRIHLFGKSEEQSLRKSKGNYIFHGPYNRGELPQLLVDNNIDLVCMFTIWPETYSYTLTESYMAKIPVLSFEIGAVGDRIKKDKLGWTIKLSEKDIIIDKIKEIMNDKEKYNNIKNNFKNYKFKTIKEMQEYYINIYNSISQDKNNKYVNIYDLKELTRKAMEIDFMQYQASYGHVIHRYEKLRNTKLWKVAKKVKAKLRNSN